MPDTTAVAASANPTQTTLDPRYQGGLGPAFQALLWRIDEHEAEIARRGIRDWLLATTLAIYHALQRGDSVPVGELNPDAVKRYGLKKRGVA